MLRKLRVEYAGAIYHVMNHGDRRELLGQMSERAGENHYATERQESGEARARGIVAAELKRLGWTAAELRLRRKGDPGKISIAMRLRTETTMTLKWIAGELQMGAWTHVSNLRSQLRQQGAKKRGGGVNS